MEIKILVGDKGNVDFEHPIELDATEKEKFFSLLNSLFAIIDKIDVSEFRSWRMGEGGRIQYPHSWDDKEHHFLLSCRSIQEAVDKLGRSGMSVIIQAGFWVPRYYSWCKEKKKHVSEWNKLETIQEFMKEKEEIKKSKTKKRQQDRKELKELCMERDNLRQEIPADERMIDVPMAKVTKESIDKKKDRLKTVEERIKEFKELSES